MKHVLKSLLVGALVAGTASGATLPSMDVTVREKAGGKVVSSAKTDSRGNFATPEVQPGSYTVEFRSKNAAALAGTTLQISVSPAKGPATEATAPGARFGGGVAVAVNVKRASALTGQVSSAAAQTLADTGETKGPLRPGSVRIINGKRFVWMVNEMGSNIGGKWVPEGSPGAPAANTTRGNADSLRRMQDQSGQGAIPGG